MKSRSSWKECGRRVIGKILKDLAENNIYLILLKEMSKNILSVGFCLTFMGIEVLFQALRRFRMVAKYFFKFVLLSQFREKIVTLFL